jgi:hypothetical protein
MYYFVRGRSVFFNGKNITVLLSENDLLRLCTTTSSCLLAELSYESALVT